MKISIEALQEYAIVLCNEDVKFVVYPAICDTTWQLGKYVRIYPHCKSTEDKFYEVCGTVILKGE